MPQACASSPATDTTLPVAFPLVAAVLNVLSAQSCIIDGEAIICDDKGLSVFDLIRYRHYDHVASFALLTCSN
jgi:ATP-dependent DNA ligase